MGLFLAGPKTLVKPGKDTVLEINQTVTLNLLAMQDFSKFLKSTQCSPYEGFKLFKQSLGVFNHLSDFDELEKGYFTSVDDFMLFTQREMFCTFYRLDEPISELTDVFIEHWESNKSMEIIDDSRKLVYTERLEDEVAFALGILVPLQVHRFKFATT